ncbi:unnamed protein product [Thelazia callipaeda]|uniref:G_PROTEIN_RECEP_F1_2 domain-containing protein n=1 Tax=Thelazia callipaeda TaxID=103827 RepID=A0A0N5DAM3_THECL|nr:unnamed protein product [Thelazia callipaeda]
MNIFLKITNTNIFLTTKAFYFQILSNEMFSTVVILCDILGFLCILLNLFIITIIIKHRKRILRNVFYIMVFHCSIVDLLRGCCLIIWGLPHIVIGNHTSIHDRLLFTIVILRSCNLLTIFNLLIFTCNEYIVIRYPLLYRRHFKRQILCYVSIMCTIRRIRNEVFLNSGHVIINITVHLVITKKSSYSNKQRRHWKTHLMSRHKYLIVIGTILFVYILFLFPYSGMQLLAFLHLSNILVSPFRSAVIRWSLQILIGMHAVCQPLCYFRMVEFRRLACHKRKTKVQQNFYSRDPNKSGDNTIQITFARVT